MTKEDRAQRMSSRAIQEKAVSHRAEGADGGPPEGEQRLGTKEQVSLPRADTIDWV